MIKKKPTFWDDKKPNFLSYLLLPFTLPVVINNFFLSFKKKRKKIENIKSICIGNIYVGGTGKTPLTIKLYELLKNLNLKTATIKKYYKDQLDEQKLLKNKTKFYCFNERKLALNKAIDDNVEVAIFDDGLQDLSINYDLNFVCFNNTKWIGNGFLIPAGPLREKIESLSKYDVVFLNGNEINNSELKIHIRKYNPNIMIFETCYLPKNIHKFDINKKYLIFSAIGNPESFKETLIKNKLNIVKEIKFADHYQYTNNDVDKIKLEAKKLNAEILTTEKDYVKINHNKSSEIFFLEIDIIIKQEEKLINFIKSRI